jgi:hypothetical protein
MSVFSCFHLLRLSSRLHNYSRNFQHSDMMDEMKADVMELVATACEKHSANNEVSGCLYLLLDSVRK